MIKFFKKLLGIKTPCTCPSTPKETMQEILTPTTKVEVAPVSTFVEPAKPANKKVKAISSPVPAKPKAKPAVSEGKAKGGNNVVKLQPKQGNKPKAPGKPKAKRK